MINTKTTGELGLRIEYDVEHDLFHPQNVYSKEYITPTFVEYVRKLEQENTELKGRECWKSCEYANPKSELIGQHIKDVQNLTKAKELLNHWANSYGGVDITLCKETQQFLSEAGKRRNQIPFQGRALFFDLTTKKTFSVTEQQFEKAKRDFDWWNNRIEESGKVGTVDFVIWTETGRHWAWVYKSDEDYSEYEVENDR